MLLLLGQKWKLLKLVYSVNQFFHKFFFQRFQTFARKTEMEWPIIREAYDGNQLCKTDCK